MLPAASPIIFLGVYESGGFRIPLALATVPQQLRQRCGTECQ
jgi:hypothetical protein